jgi:hypothetical protein
MRLFILIVVPAPPTCHPPKQKYTGISTRLRELPIFLRQHPMSISPRRQARLNASVLISPMVSGAASQMHHGKQGYDLCSIHSLVLSAHSMAE